MIRHILAVALAFCLSTSWSSAQPAPQRAELTVKSPAAEVHKFPSIGSPVIGKVPSGSVLEIRRNLGLWVEVPWPGGENGTAFLHVNTGTISSRAVTEQNQVAAMPAPSTPSSAVATDARTERVTSANSSGLQGPEYISLPRHVVGVGGRLSGSAPDFGATTRMWLGKRLGMQFELSRSRLDSVNVQGHINSVLFAPSVLYSLPDAVAGSVWMRPYVGGGSNLYRSTLSPVTSAVVSTTETDWGFQALGGAEATFAGIPQFGLSAEVGYRWSQPSFAGFERNRTVFAIAVHWYVK